jgi:ribosomal protein S18 acetylase RimI-like enzyme
MTDSFVVEPLGPSHDRKGFRCGVDALDRYFRNQVGQDVRRRVTACFVARETETNAIAGYYTLSAGSVPLVDLPTAFIERLPRYPTVPIARLGRLAVSLAYRGRNIGAGLVWDAYARARKSEVAAFAILVDAKDEQAANFYIRHEFTRLEPNGRTLILPL